jgi:deoxyribose-phosphate aldolase
MGNIVDPNSNIQPEERAPLITYADVAGRLELHLTRPDLSEEQVDEACRRAVAYQLGAVVVRPSDVDMAARILNTTSTLLVSVAGFPHGSSNTATKLYEGRDLLRRGAKEVNLVVNYGKMLSRQFQHVETEILQMSESCHQNETVLKLVYESAYLAEDLKIILCKMAKRTDTDFIESDSLADLPLLKQICKDVVKRKVTVTTLEELQAAHTAFADRMGSIDAFAIADAWKAELAAREAIAKAEAAAKQPPTVPIS